jgi:hypothetical protein
LSLKNNLQIKGILEALSKTPSINNGYQQLIVRHYDKLWRINISEEKQRENLIVFRLKQKCLDRFVNQFQEKGE